MIGLKRGLDMPGPSPSDGSQTAKQGPVLRSRAAAFGALTIDVEDYFQVEAFAKIIHRQDWEGQQPRVFRNTDRLLDILAEAQVSATFFTLGWIASRNPQLVRRIVCEGHEL